MQTGNDTITGVKVVLLKEIKTIVSLKVQPKYNQKLTKVQPKYNQSTS